jgi:hypothetical protein
MRDDTSSVAAVRRLNSSFVGQAQRALWEGGHIVALLRGMQTSNELKLRVKNDVLIVQFLEWRAALYRVLNSDSFVFMIGLREACHLNRSFHLKQNVFILISDSR